MDPYYDTTFFDWCIVLFSRLFYFDGSELYTDEVQLCVLVLFGISASLLGVLLVLSKNTLLANSISHTMLLGIVISIIGVRYFSPDACYVPTWVIHVASSVVGLATCYIIEKLSKVQYLTTDSSNAMVFSFLFATGIAIISLYSKNAHVGSELLMGDPDSLDVKDLPSVCIAALTTIVGIPLFLRAATVVIFDSAFAAVSGFKPNTLVRGILLLTSFVSIVAFRAVGFVMTMAFFVLPPLIAKLRARSVAQLLWGSSLISSAAAFFSVGLSRHLYTVYDLSVSTGAFSAVLLTVFYLLLLCIPKTKASTCLGIKLDSIGPIVQS